MVYCLACLILFHIQILFHVKEGKKDGRDSLEDSGWLTLAQEVEA